MNLKETEPQKNLDQKVDCQPNPARFAIYNVLPGEFGFTIPNCDFVFEFDQHGGWFDEYGNYYNAQGEPAEVPVDFYEDLQGDPQSGYYEDEVFKNDANDEKEDEPLEFYDNQYLNQDNQKVLEKYTQSKEINIELHNLSFHWNEDDFERFLIDNKIEWIVFQFEYDEKAQFSGRCYITLDNPNTQKLLELNGYKILGKNLNVLVIEPPKEVKTNEHHHKSTDGPNSSELKKPQEEAKTLENDRIEPTIKRPYPDGKPLSFDKPEKLEKKNLQSEEKNVERIGLPTNGSNKETKKGD